MNDSDYDFANSALSFPQKLFALLEQEGDEAELIQWVNHGYCFRILNPDIFANEIVPKYFKQTKLTSFQRQLNLYGFRRIAKGPDQGCYFHPKFQRNRRDLLPEVKRLPAKGSLPSYDQFISSVSNLPSELYSSKTRKRSHQEAHPPTTKKEVSPPIHVSNISTRNSVAMANISTSQSVQAAAISSKPVQPQTMSQAMKDSQYNAPPSIAATTATVTTALRPPSIPTPAPRTMSRLTMNIGYGRNIFPSSAPFPSFAVTNNTIYPGGVRFIAPSSDMSGANTSQDSSSGSMSANSSFRMATYENVAVPISSNFSSENSLFRDTFTRDIMNDSFIFDNSQQNQGSVNNDLSTQPFPPSMFGDDLDVLDLFSGDIPQSVHGTPHTRGASPLCN